MLWDSLENKKYKKIFLLSVKLHNAYISHKVDNSINQKPHFLQSDIIEHVTENVLNSITTYLLFENQMGIFLFFVSSSNPFFLAS